MLEANPGLAPRQVKRLVLQTARRLPHVDVDRQGWGVVDARAAVGRPRGGRTPKSTGAPLGRPGNGLEDDPLVGGVGFLDGIHVEVG